MLKILIVAVLAMGTLCEEFQAYHYKDGKMMIEKEQADKIEGPIFIELLKTMNITILAGMHFKGSQKTAFGFVGKISSFSRSADDKFELVASCWEASWGLKPIKGLTGSIMVHGVWNKEAHMNGSCLDKAGSRNYTFHACGNYSKSGVYTYEEAAKRAQLLIGQKAHDYKAVHVVNFAVIGYPYLGSMRNCSSYLKLPNATEAKAGYIIVGNDGHHCGIVDAEGDKFVHTNPQKKEVGLSSLGAAKQFFRKGFVFKTYG